MGFLGWGGWEGGKKGRGGRTMVGWSSWLWRVGRDLLVLMELGGIC